MKKEKDFEKGMGLGISMRMDFADHNMSIGIRKCKRYNHSDKKHDNKYGWIVYVACIWPDEELGDHNVSCLRINHYDKASKVFFELVRMTRIKTSQGHLDMEECPETYLFLRNQLLNRDHKFYDVGNKDNFPSFDDIFPDGYLVLDEDYTIERA